jgi:hypothetical protein
MVIDCRRTFNFYGGNVGLFVEPKRATVTTRKVCLLVSKTAVPDVSLDLADSFKMTSRIPRQSEHEGGKVVSPTHQLPLPPARKYSWYSFLLEVESTPGP